jgi:hypothetical protein
MVLATPAAATRSSRWSVPAGDAVLLHDQAAEFWEKLGKPTHAADERRKAQRERDGARLDREP